MVAKQVNSLQLAFLNIAMYANGSWCMLNLLQLQSFLVEVAYNVERRTPSQILFLLLEQALNYEVNVKSNDVCL